VDLGVIWFLIRGEDEGIELAECPHNVSEWMLREKRRKSRAADAVAWKPLGGYSVCRWGAIRHWLAV